MASPEPSRYIWIDGGVAERAAFDPARNRAFRYGDGLIETVRLSRGELLFFHDHMDRMFAGLQALMLPVEAGWDARFFYERIGRLLTANGVTSSARIRIQVWRTGEGLYAPSHQGADFLIETTEATDQYEFNDAGFSAGVSQNVRKTYDRLANVKTSSALTYVMAALEAKEKNKDLLFVLNERGVVADAPGRNVFILEKGNVITPPLTDAGVAGVFRFQLLELLRSHNIVTREESIDAKRLAEAEEIFVTNVMDGIQPVTMFEAKAKPAVQSKELYRLFRNHLLHVE